MKLIRSWSIPDYKKKFENGPKSGGFFMCLKRFNDLPLNHQVSEHELGFLLNTGEVFMKDSQARGGSWTKIECVQDVKKRNFNFTSLFRDYEVILVAPFMPEFYYVPKNFRGKRHMRRSPNRARKKGDMLF
ncbi:MAG: hypothetical protein OEV93_05175 [Candidatus Moranbacteria bacterium]|nr:hypothetical protein [Candidatus Moranbacteria bacterium]